jgi:hypothetical protein
MIDILTPELYPIDAQQLLFGSIHLTWSDVGANTYLIFRDYEKITDISGWHEYAAIDQGKTYYEDNNIQNHRIYYYVVVAAVGNERSGISNCVGVKTDFPEHIMIDTHSVAEAAYYESQSPRKFEEKIWELARMSLILERSFPNRSVEYLKIKVKSIKKDLPEFTGLFFQPTENEIRNRAQEISYLNPDRMEVDWNISERELIIKKIQELLEVENKVR